MTRRRREAKDMTVEEFDDWSKASRKFDEVAEAADEVGGPRLSLVPLPEQNAAWPTDLLPPVPPPACLGEGDQPRTRSGAEAAISSADSSPPVAATPFDGIPLESSRKRLAGWSAERQRLFL